MIHLANTYNTLGRLQDAVEIEERVQHFQRRFLSHDDPNIGELKTFLFVFGFNLMLLLLPCCRSFHEPTCRYVL